MSAIEALYIFDEHNTLLVDHIYTNRPAPPSTLLPLYLQQPQPRPSLLYLPSLTPPTLCYSIKQDNLLFLSPTTTPTTEPLLILEFLHRVSDALQEFLGTPLLAPKLTTSYDVVAQILTEVADAGVISSTEANALRDVVETGPGVLKNLLGSIGASGTSPGLAGGGSGSGVGSNSLSSSTASSSLSSALRPQHLSPSQQQQNTLPSALPWRRTNVRHTSNELYVDFVESLSIVLAPSGRPLSAFAHGSVVFNCRVSGVPDLLLNLSTGGWGAGMGTKGEQVRRVMERVVFHPCVRLNRWKSEGVLSFVPPDGRFALCGYEVDLLGPAGAPLTVGGGAEARAGGALNLPATLDITTGLGGSGAEFEVRVTSPSSSSSSSQPQPARSPAASSLQSHLNLTPSTSRTKALTTTPTDPAAPPLEGLAVHIPLPAARVRNVSELRASKGEAHWNPADGVVEWRIGAKDFASGGGGGVGSAVLRCTVQGNLGEEEDGGVAVGGGLGVGVMNGLSATTYDYDDGYEYEYDEGGAYQSQSEQKGKGTAAAVSKSSNGSKDAQAADTTPRQQQQQKLARNKDLMPTSATLSFSLKGSLPSGLRVESLLVDTKKSRGLGAEIKPYKGVKYLTVSEKGVEVRC